jgi:transcriptional regulator with XRE-family HTH domain
VKELPKIGLNPVDLEHIPRGQRIELLRRINRLSRRRLGERVGRTALSVYNWERKGARPGIDVLQDLAATLGVSVDVLAA